MKMCFVCWRVDVVLLYSNCRNQVFNITIEFEMVRNKNHNDKAHDRIGGWICLIIQGLNTNITC